MDSMRVLLCGGGTGGHLVPGLVLARRLLTQGHAVDLVRPGRQVEEHFLDGSWLGSSGLHGLGIHRLPMHRGKLRLPFSFARAVRRSRRLLSELDSEMVVGLGGLASLPPLVAAWSKGIPFALLEQNLVVGKVNKLALRFAHRMYTAFPLPDTRMGKEDTPKDRALLLDKVRDYGMPLRPGIPAARDEQLKHRFAIAPSKKVILILGGSQGARDLNLALPAFLAELPEAERESLAVLHVAGPGKETECAEAWQRTGLEAHVFEFIEDLAPYYAIADLVVCRGGGTTLYEVASAGRPALVVPYPWHADRQQALNASYFVKAGVFAMVEQEMLCSAGSARQEARDWIASLLSEKELCRSLGQRASSLLPRGAADRIGMDLLKIRGGRPSSIR